MITKMKYAIILASLVLVFSGLTVYAAGADRSTTVVRLFQDTDSINLPFADRTVVTGSSSKIVRNDSGVSVTLHSEGLTPGAYTAWMVIWNNPPDGFDPAALPESLAAPAPLGFGMPPDWISRGTGAVVGSSGKGNFGAHLSVGDTSEPLYPWNSSDGPGLTNPRGALVWIVLRYHGPVDSDFMPDQIHTFWGGCTPDSVADVHEDPDNPPDFGIYACYEPQSAAHVP